MIKDFKPLNPWGRSMPKVLGKSSNPKDAQLYQVHVETREGKVVPVGPKMMHQWGEELIMAINTQIAKGREKEWSNPVLLPVKSLLT